MNRLHSILRDLRIVNVLFLEAIDLRPVNAQEKPHSGSARLFVCFRTILCK